MGRVCVHNSGNILYAMKLVRQGAGRRGMIPSRKTDLKKTITCFRLMNPTSLANSANALTRPITIHRDL